jgi:EAL domain-containing protein (putative c-di-GMP-specific phosphodiesterase class I)
VAEESDTIVRVTMQCLVKSCQQLKKWRDNNGLSHGVTMSVNVSPRHFSKPNLLTLVEEILRESSLPAECLKLEITERTVMENADSPNSILLQLRALNVQLHIDDFGTGYSSLAYLSRFPIDALKIDKSFVDELCQREESLEIARAIISMAQSLRLETIAEGIETYDQLMMLKDLGCTYGQGYYFAQPLAAEEIEELLGSEWKM